MTPLAYAPRIHVAGPIDADGAQRCLGCNATLIPPNGHYLDVGDQVVRFYDPATEKFRARRRKKRRLHSSEIFCHTARGEIRDVLTQVEVRS